MALLALGLVMESEQDTHNVRIEDIVTFIMIFFTLLYCLHVVFDSAPK